MPMPRKAIKITRAQRVTNWIEKFCRVPAGPLKGKYVRLSQDQRQLLADIYGHDDSPRAIAVSGEMGAYLALLHTAGIEASPDIFATIPDITVDPWTLWAAAGPELQKYIERDGAGAITCSELGTRFPRRAA